MYKKSPPASTFFHHAGLSQELGPAVRNAALRAASLVGEGLNDAVVGGVLAEVLEPQEGSTLALEEVGDPAEGIIEVPDGDTDAAADLDAGADDVLVGLALQGKVLLGGRGLESDVELGESHLDAELGEAADGGNVVVERGVLLGDEVGLQADAVDGDLGVLEELDDALGALRLGRGPLEVVVVVVELGLRVDLGGGLEGKLDVLLAENLVENALAVGSVLVQRLVDNVPGVALALVVAGDGGDVVDDDLAQLLRSPLGLLDPGSQLAVPDESVAAQQLAVLAGLGGNDVALGEVEDAALGLNKQPLKERVSIDTIQRSGAPGLGLQLTFWPLVGVVEPNSGECHMILSYSGYLSSRPARSRWPGVSVAAPKYFRPAFLARTSRPTSLLSLPLPLPLPAAKPKGRVASRKSDEARCILTGRYKSAVGSVCLRRERQDPGELRMEGRREVALCWARPSNVDRRTLANLTMTEWLGVVDATWPRRDARAGRIGRAVDRVAGASHEWKHEGAHFGQGSGGGVVVINSTGRRTRPSLRSSFEMLGTGAG
jgi:hypothetical protein